MLLLLLLNSLGLLIPVIVWLCLSKFQDAKYWLSITAIFLILNFCFIYIFLPSRNMLSIIGSNIIPLICFVGAYWYYQNDNCDGSKPNSKPFFQAVLLGGALILLIGIFGECHSKFAVKKTYNSINSEKVSAKEAPTFKRGETPVAITPATVLNRTRKSLSDLPNSQYYNVSDQIQAQYYKGKPVYIVPIKYDGFFAMQKAHKQIPGYFMIDATKQNATPKFIKKPYPYAITAYFNHDVTRQLYRANPQWIKLGDGYAQLEVDNHGTPYWVQTVYQPEALSHRINYHKLHVTVMNAQTGAVKNYALKNLPSWIDEGLTSDVAAQMNHDYGHFSHGYWNNYFGKTDIKIPTDNGPEDGVTSVFDSKGHIHYFTDFTNPNSSDSALGYSMINARTGKLTYYHASGLMDSDGATKNADQNYKAQKWHASMPIIYNVNGKPTWVMTILDDTHAIRGYYYLDAQDQSVYGNGSSVNSALDSFRQALVDNDSSAGNTPESKTKKVSGVVDRLAVISSKNKVMFTLQGSNVIYTINTDDYNDANLLRTGDNVKFTAKVVNGKSIGNVDNFKNESLR